MSSRVEILLGPPGTGKTTHLLGIVEQALSNGTAPERIAYLAFTRKAAEEAITRAVKALKCEAKDLPYFRTLHSLAFKMLGLSHSDVMNTGHYKVLGEALGSYDFNHSYGAYTERAYDGGGLGDRCLQLCALSQTTGQPLEDVWRGAVDNNVSISDLKRFSSALRAFKGEHQLFEFSDFITECQTELDIDILILDEAQDLTAQQWDLARRLGKRARKIYIAGDDDQAIFGWAGADHNRLISLKGHRHVLPKSYRLPADIHALACSVSERIMTRIPKTWEPRKAKGLVQYHDEIETLDITEGQWLLLARHSYQLAEYEELCRAIGVVYYHKGKWSNNDATVRAVKAYERMRAGKLAPAKDAVKAAELGGAEQLLNAVDGFHKYSDFDWRFNGDGTRPDWMVALNLMSLEEREYIRLLRRRGESMSEPGRIKLSTIHAAKGGEAENVALTLDYSYRTWRAARNDPDAEARVFYVGLSRAINELHIINPSTNRSFQL